jgi:ATP-dependent Lon protease
MSNHDILPADQILPNKLIIIPLTGNPIFPGIFTPLVIEDEQDIAAVEAALERDSMIGLLLTKSSEKDGYDTSNLHKVGTAAKIVKKINLPDGGLNIFISTVKRFEVRRFVTEDETLKALVDYLENFNKRNDEVKALTRSLLRCSPKR